MKRHKPKRRDRVPCDGCIWYHELYGLCCRGGAEQHGDASERCGLYVAGEPVPGVADETNQNGNVG